ncbi:TPA: cytochrome C biogenesis protein [Bacillus pseudomycoides]|nr:cytochrome C biogenesis protein [Bacillus pseudomycoides]
MEVTFVKVEVLIPEEYIETLRNELNEIGILTVGKYDHVISYSSVKGSWRPLEEAQPFNGTTFGTECKMEFRCLYEKIEEVLSIIKSIHPYEEPVIHVLPLLF